MIGMNTLFTGDLTAWVNERLALWLAAARTYNAQTWSTLKDAESARTEELPPALDFSYVRQGSYIFALSYHANDGVLTVVPRMWQVTAPEAAQRLTDVEVKVALEVPPMDFGPLESGNPNWSFGPVTPSTRSPFTFDWAVTEFVKRRLDAAAFPLLHGNCRPDDFKFVVPLR